MTEKLKKLQVRNVPAGFDSSDLEDLFTTVGNVVSAKVSEGFGYVEMESIQSAADCIERFNGYPLQGQVLIVLEDKPHVPKKKSGSSKRSSAQDLKKGLNTRNKQLSASIRAAIVANRK